jgi:hypothetical protein
MLPLQSGVLPLHASTEIVCCHARAFSATTRGQQKLQLNLTPLGKGPEFSSW